MFLNWPWWSITDDRAFFNIVTRGGGFSREGPMISIVVRVENAPVVESPS